MKYSYFEQYIEWKDKYKSVTICIPIEFKIDKVQLNYLKGLV